MGYDGVALVPQAVGARPMTEEATSNGAAADKATPKKKTAKKKASKKSPTKKASAKVAKKKTAKKSSGAGTFNKTEFILRFPALKPKEIAAKAMAEHKIELDPGYISSVRSKNKGKGSGGSRSKASAPNGMASDAEARFTSLLKRIGTDRARQLISAY